jgi:hypothetical protein
MNNVWHVGHEYTIKIKNTNLIILTFIIVLNKLKKYSFLLNYYFYKM